MTTKAEGYKELHDMGISYAEIGRQFGVSTCTVRNAVLRLEDPAYRRECNRRTAENMLLRYWNDEDWRKLKASIRKQWMAKNPEKNRARVKKWRAENPDKARANVARWRAANSEKRNASKARWRAINREKLREKRLSDYAANPDKGRAAKARYRAKKKALKLARLAETT